MDIETGHYFVKLKNGFQDDAWYDKEKNECTFFDAKSKDFCIPINIEEIDKISWYDKEGNLWFYNGEKI